MHKETVFIDGTSLHQAFLQNGTTGSSEVIRHAQLALCRYLMVTMGADAEIAREAVASAMASVLESINRGLEINPVTFYTYLLKSARHAFLKEQNRQHEHVENADYYHDVNPVNQFSRLVAHEKLHILKKCMEQLENEQRSFLQIWFSDAKTEAAEVAKKLGMSVNNVWTKKSRLIKLVSECVQKKMN